MQKLDTFGDIKKYTHKTIFASFFVNCVVNIVFLLASCYTYFVINTISTTRDIYKIITPTIITLILCAFAYANAFAIISDAPAPVAPILNKL